MPDYNRYTSILDLSILKNFFCRYGDRKQYAKGDYFSRMGEQPRSVGFILKGGFRYKCIHTTGRACIVGYAFDGGFVGDYPAFQNKTLTLIDIDAVCNSEVSVITFDQLNHFYNQTPENHLLARNIAQVLLLEIYDRMLSLYKNTPEERYLEIMERIPGILTMVSLKELASYLMITPETLSRIRKKILHT